MFIKKAARHDTKSMSNPPTTGPIAAVTPENPDQVPIALPRSSSENEELMIASEPGIINAPPIPWIVRAAMSDSELGERPHHTEATVKIAMPIMKILRRP